MSFIMPKIKKSVLLWLYNSGGTGVCCGIREERNELIKLKVLAS
jgi:hypothetical protein